MNPPSAGGPVFDQDESIWDNKRRKVFYDTLLGAFPTRSALAQMVSFRLDERLDQITPAGSMQETIFHLIEWAYAQGRLAELVTAALSANPHNPQLHALAPAQHAPTVDPAGSSAALQQAKTLSQQAPPAVTLDSASLQSPPLGSPPIVPGTISRTRLYLQDRAMNNAAYSPDGRRIVTTSHDNTVRVWDAATGEIHLTLWGHTGAVNSAAYSPDGHNIVTASDDETAQVWNAITGALRRTLQGHTDKVTSANYSPDGYSIVTASTDGTVRVWDTATGSLHRTIRGRKSGLLAAITDILPVAAWSADGHNIIATSNDHTARVWDAASGALRLTLEGHAIVLQKKIQTVARPLRVPPSR